MDDLQKTPESTEAETQVVIDYASDNHPIGADLAEFLYNQGIKSRDFTVKKIGEDLYTNFNDLKRLPKYEPAAAPVFNIFTLNGLCDWLCNDTDKNIERYGRLVVAVENEVTVSVYPPVCGVEMNRRPTLATCKHDVARFPWGQYMDQESFIVFLLSRFKEDSNANRELVGRLVGNIRQEQSAEAADDGMSQRVTVKNGIAKVGETIIKNPVYLAPMRTFCEIDQPMSPFVLRVQEGPQIALFEADAGEWRNTAVASVRVYLEAMLEGLNVTIIA